MTIIARQHQHRRPCTIDELVNGGEVQPFKPFDATRLDYKPVTEPLNLTKIPQTAELSDCAIYASMVANFARKTDGRTPDVITVKVGFNTYELWRKTAECNPYVRTTVTNTKTDVVVIIR